MGFLALAATVIALIWGGGLATRDQSFQALPTYRLEAKEWSRIKYGGVFIEVERVADRIKDLLEPGESFYEWGSEPGLYVHTRLSPPSGVFYALPLLDGPLVETLSARVISDLEKAPPELLVVNTDVTAPPAHAVMSWLDARYRVLPPDLQIESRFELRALIGGELERRILSSTLASLLKETPEASITPAS